jgi:hypothetical protein
MLFKSLLPSLPSVKFVFSLGHQAIDELTKVLPRSLREGSRRDKADRGRWLVFRPHTRQPSAIQASAQAGLVTIAGQFRDDLAPGTQNSILK